ncbi:hypothetical protein NBM05_04950 [Rothia sp. AR01]|uniref:Uncharacterized protein n=1 Tax=Rothia santali TaxID=2949643 RepID=A0A9X2KKT1_9MICC|nr:hypothetical protein [Rothia santali]MCP3425381.1 hypothetical protein [Rothia santali]
MTVWISVDGSRPARITGEAVRDAVERAVGAEGWSPVRVEVAILDVV